MALTKFRIFYHLLNALLIAKLVVETEAQSSWPVNKCAFTCQNYGLCNAINVCSCEPGWLGVDCSIPNMTVTSMANSPYLTRIYSYFERNFTSWNFGVDISAPFQKNTGALQLTGNNAMWTQNPFNQQNFVLTATMRISSDSAGSGFMLLFAQKSSYTAGQPYGITWSQFQGMALRLSKACNGMAIIARTSAVDLVPACNEGTVKQLPGFDFVNLQTTFRIQVVVRYGYLYAIDLCTVSGGCFSPFADVDLANKVGSISNFNLMTLHLGVGAGNGSTIDVFEYRVKEIADYIKDYSLLYTEFSANWVLNRFSSGGAVSDPPGTIRLVPAITNSYGAIWTKLVNAVIDMATDPTGNGNGNGNGGLGIFLASMTSMSPTAGFGIENTTFQGIGTIVAPASNGSCVKFAVTGTTFDTSCSTPGSYLGTFTDGSFNLRKRLQVSVTVSTYVTSRLSVTICNGPSLCKTPVSYVDLGVSVASLPPLYLGLGAYSDSQRDSVDVLEVKTYSPSDNVWLVSCKNGGYINPSGCICQSGWTGSDCSQPICSPTCPAKNRCVAPNSCVCIEGWGNPPLCNIPKCLNDCPLHAACVAPNTCKCISGWTGADCSVASKAIRNSIYGAALLSSFSVLNTSNTSSNWQLLQPNNFDLSFGGVQPNGALRLAPSLPSNRGALWNLAAIGKSNLLITGTVEMGRTGVMGDGFTVALVSPSATLKSTTYTAGSEYMIRWNQNNVFVGAAYNFIPSRNEICIPMRTTPGGVNYNSGSACFALASTQIRRKFEFSLKVRTMATRTYFFFDVCNSDVCLLNVTAIYYTAAMATASFYLGIAAENNPSQYDSFDIFEIKTYEMILCSSTCTGLNFACSAAGTCTCQDGWTGTTCQTPVCPNAPVAHAICSAPFVWACQAGWTGYDCSSALCPNGIPKYGACTAPSTVTCISGWSGSDCSIPTFITPYYATALTSQSFTGSTVSLTNFIFIPSVASTSYYSSFLSTRIADSIGAYNGAMFSNTGVILMTNFSINATVEAKKSNVNGGYYTIVLAGSGVSYTTAPGNGSVITWQTFIGLAVLFYPRTGRVCLIFASTPTYGEKTCQLTSNVTVDLAQKVRIGIVTIQNSIWVDVCATTGCQSVFANAVFATGYGLQYIGSLATGVAASLQPNSTEAVDVYELAAYSIASCSIQCLNGGTCTANNVCTCTYGWTGQTCETPSCSPTCVHGTCIAGTPNHCDCSTGWLGLDCNIPICTSQCLHAGNCTAPDMCTCPSGWKNNTCQTADCTDIGGCKNGGTCSAPNECTCASDYKGTDCSQLDLIHACLPACSAYGYCTGIGICTCVSGWTDPTCSTPICTPGCSNGGTCTLTNTCSCAPGWTGSTCTQAICDLNHVCQHGTCSGPNTCSCISPGWTGPMCDTPVCASCSSIGGNCTGPDVCSCNNGWCGTDCSTPICEPPCRNNGTCSSPGVCTCSELWTDNLCSTPVCAPSCMNGGTCMAPNTCSCPTGWTNNTCETAVCPNGCVNGECTSPGVCTCEPGWAGSTCSNAYCDSEHECLNGGSCSHPNTCTCSPDWAGALCSVPICSIPCQNGGTCYLPNVCNCTSNWTSSDCSIPSCLKNPCQFGDCTAPDTCTCWGANYTGPSCSTPVCSPDCANGGTCSSPDVCNCTTDWTGPTCQIPVCSGGCLNNGNCTAPGDCTCEDGWTGAKCEIAICDPPCSGVSGFCAAPPNNCTCSSGWTGATCNIAVCSYDCGHGTCSSPEMCSCNSGWTGSNCSTAICTETCKNNGTCIAPDVCACTSGWNGTDCSKAICNDQCLHGGTCSAPNTCTCPSGYNGTSCEFTLCVLPCQNGGTCLGNNVCKCLDGWVGNNCEILNSSSAVLKNLASQTNQFIVENLGAITAAASSMQTSVEPAPPSVDLQLTSDVVSPGNIARLVDSIVANPDASPPSNELFSDKQLEAQSVVVSTLNKVTRRILELGDAITPEQLSSLTDVLAKAADEAATKALQRALTLETAVVKSDRFDSQPKLPCTPLIADTQRASLKKGSTTKKLEMLHSNFSDFIDGLTIALLRAPLQFGESKAITGDFYSVIVKRSTIASLSDFSLQSQLGGVTFPTFETRKPRSYLKFHDPSSAKQLNPSNPVLVLLSTYVSNILDAESPYNFPTVTVRVFTADSRLELDWTSSAPIQITSKPPEWNKKQFNKEKSQSQCDPRSLACDLSSNANSMGTLVTFPMPPNAGDFILSVKGDQSLPFNVFIGFKEKPHLTTYTWMANVTNTSCSVSENASLPSLGFRHGEKDEVRFVISQKAITLIAGRPVTKVVEATTPLTLYVLIKRDLSAFGQLEDLPKAACEMLKCDGYNFRISTMEPTKYRRRRQASSADQVEPSNGFELDSGSTETELSFKSQYFGTFGADLLIAPNTIEFSNIFANFETLVANNWFVLATMVVAISLFLIVVIPMHIFDKRDLKQWAFLPIKSNCPHENMRYLVSVHCNGCKNYHLGPKVDIRLHGDVTSTQWRRLDDGLRRDNFSSTRPSNFIVTTYHPIGSIERLELGVKTETASGYQNGTAVELDVDKVVVVDVAMGRKCVFLCRSKLGLAKTSKQFQLAKEDDIKGFAYLLSGHSRVTAKDAHLWLSIVQRPLPSNWTRCERLACIISAVFLAMLTNAMFYGKEPASPRLGVNVGGLFRVSWFTFWTSLVSCAIVLPPTSLIAFVFQFVRRRSAEKSQWATIFNIKVKETADDDSAGDDERELTGSTSKGTARLVAKPPRKKEKIKKPFQLPFWCLFIAWALVGACVGLSAFFVTLYSLSWGQEKSLQWLSGIVLHVLQDIFIVQTLKVLMVAVFKAGKLSLPDDGLAVGRLTYSRENTRRRVELFQKLRAIVTGLGHHVMYVAAFALVIGSTRNEFSYSQVKALKPHLFVDGYSPLTDTIPDPSVLFDYLLYKIIPNFLNGNQLKYGLSFPVSDFYAHPNHDVVLIGPIRIRQNRAPPTPCLIQKATVKQMTARFGPGLANDTFCVGNRQGFDAFNDDLLERRHFNGTWNTPIDWLDASNLTKFQEAWLYRETDGLSYFGELANYKTGGYYVDLPGKLQNALRVVAQLRKNRWIDANSTAFFVDFVLYNPQTNVFVAIKIAFESLSTGGMIYQVRRYPIQLYQYSGANSILAIIMQAFWILLLFSHIGKMFYKLHKEGLKQFAKNHWNLLNVAHLVLGLVIVGLLAARIFVTIGTIERMKTYEDQFTNLDTLVYWDDLIYGLLGFGFFLTMMAFFQYLEADKYWAIFLATLSKGKKDILAYVAFFIIVSAIFAAFLHLLVGSSMAAFCSYKTSILTLLQRIIGSSQMTKLGFPTKFSMGCSMVYSAGIIFCGAQVFIAIINKIYGSVNSNVEKETGWDAELAKYIAEEFRKLITIKSNKSKESDVDTVDSSHGSDNNRQKEIKLPVIAALKEQAFNGQDKGLHKFDDMMDRVSKMMSKFGFADENTLQSMPTRHEQVRKKDSFPLFFEIEIPSVKDQAQKQHKLENKEKGLSEPEVIVEPELSSLKKEKKKKEKKHNDDEVKDESEHRRKKKHKEKREEEHRKTEGKDDTSNAKKKKKKSHKVEPLEIIEETVRLDSVTCKSDAEKISKAKKKKDRAWVDPVVEDHPNLERIESNREDLSGSGKTAHRVRNSYLAYLMGGSIADQPGTSSTAVNVVDSSGVGIMPMYSDPPVPPAQIHNQLQRRTSNNNRRPLQQRPSIWWQQTSYHS